VADDRRARVAVLGAFSSLGVAWGAWGAVVPGVRVNTRADEAALGVALLLVAVGAVPAMLAAPRVLAPRPGLVLPVAIVVLGAAFALAGATRSVAQLAAVMIFVGAASGLVDVGSNAVTARLEALTGRSLLQLGHGAFSSAVVVAALATGSARQVGAGPLPVLGGAAVVMAALAVAVRVALAALPLGATSTGPVSDDDGRGRDVARAVAVLGVLAATALAVESGFQTWSAEHLERVLDAAPAVGGAATALFAAGAAAGRLAAHRNGPALGGPRLFLVGASTGAAGALVTAVAPVSWVALVGVALAGAGVSVLFPLLLGQATRLRPAAPERAVSTVTVIGYAGFLVSPPLVGAVAGPYSLRAGFGMLAAFAGVLALIGPRVVGRQLRDHPGRRLPHAEQTEPMRGRP
jgi:hypothetical protein